MRRNRAAWPEDFDAPTKAEIQAMRREARTRTAQMELAYRMGAAGEHRAAFADDDDLTGAWDAGAADRAEDNAAGRKPSSSSRRRVASSPGRRVARRRPTRRPITRRVAAAAAAPVRAQAASGVRTLGLMLGLVALFLVLENAGAATGALGALSKGLEWLRAPDRSIPYGS